MSKYILVSTYASGMKLEIAHSEYDTLKDVKKELVKLDLEDDVISEIISGNTACDDYDSLCYWKLIEVNNVKT